MIAPGGPQFRTLPNGVRVIVDPMPDFKSAACAVWVDAGARDERPDEGGAAHLIEHMAFKGAGERSAREIVEAIEGVGGWINAETTYERTSYFVRCLSEDLRLGLQTLRDVALRPRFEPADLAVERNVVLQEIGEAADNPEDCACDGLQQVAFAGCGLGRSILGPREVVRMQTTERLRAFHEDMYRADGLIVAIAGGIDAPAAFRQAEELFAAAPVREGARRARGEARFAGGLKLIDAPSEQAHVAIAFQGAGATRGGAEGDKEIGGRLLAEIFGGGMASVLFQELRERRGLAYTIDAGADCYSDIGALVVYAGVEAGEAGDLVAAVRDELARLATGVAPQDLARARAALRAGALMALEQPMGRLEAAASRTLTHGRPIAPADIEAMIDAASVEDVTSAAEAAARGPVAVCAVGGLRGKARTAIERAAL